MASRCVSASAAAAAPRRAIAFCIAPLLLLGGISGASALRPWQTASATGMTDFGRVAIRSGYAAEGARQTTNAFLQRLLGRHTYLSDSSLLDVYSLRQQKRSVREWSVLCKTNAGDYLFRIDVKSRRICAVNRLEPMGPNPEAASSMEVGKSDSTYDVDKPLSRLQGRAQALRYLALVGFPPRTLTTASSSRGLWQSVESPNRVTAQTWNFTFQNSRDAYHPVVIAINRTNGRLQTLWSPTHPI